MIRTGHLAGGVSGLDNELLWHPQMPRPPFDVEGYQKRIDAVVGKSRDRSILVLKWGPEVFRYRPHAIHETPEGHNLPTYLAMWDSEGREVAAPRWVVMERDEHEHFAPQWEDNRWQIVDGQLYDVKGPCPEERYTELWVHAYHDKGRACCKRLGDSCYGYYAPPNDDLLGRITRAANRIKQDPDVKPYSSARNFTAPQAQREVRDRMYSHEGKRQEMLVRILDDARKKREKQTAYSIPGLKQTPSGLYLLD